MFTSRSRRVRLHKRICEYLEDVARTWGDYEAAEAKDESPYDLIRLCYVKILDDCRAIETLSKYGHHLQGGILMRSAHDACNLMMRLLMEPEDIEFLDEWRQDGRLKHWDIVAAINELQTESKINLDTYGKLQERLNDLVHGNYPALASYPAQVLGTRADKRRQMDKTRFWDPLVDLCLFSCLMVADVESEKSNQAKELMRALGIDVVEEDS